MNILFDDKINILLVGTDFGLVKNILSKEGYIVHISNTLDLHGISKYLQPELIILLIKENDYLQTLQAIKKLFNAFIICYMPKYDEIICVKSLENGAIDALSGQFGSKEHLTRIRAILRRIKNQSSNGVYETGDLVIDRASRAVSLSGKPIHLTPIEFRILCLLAKNAGTALTHDEIIDEIWGPYNSDSGTLRVNIKNIRKKIEPDPPNFKYILTDVGVGYRMS